jgi:multiple antibiotic resistance protein
VTSSTWLSATIVLFFVLDPLGNIGLFLTATKDVPAKRQRWVIIRESLFALVALIVFLFFGWYILSALHVTESSLGIGGGVILLLIAVKMIFPSFEESLEKNEDSEPFIVPLAIPLVAGPSAMATVILLMAGDPKRWLEWLGAVLVAWGASTAILLFSMPLSKILGKKGIRAVERLMGMLLITIAVEMVVSGVQQAFHVHP